MKAKFWYISVICFRIGVKVSGKIFFRHGSKVKSLFEFGGAREKDSSLEHQNWALSNNDKCEEKHKMVIVGLTGKFTEKFENLSKKFEKNEQPVVKPHSAAVRIRKRRSLRDSNRRCINIFEQPKPDRYCS